MDYPATINSGDTITYTYDAMGNRLEKQSILGTTEEYEHNTANNQMTRRFISGYYDYGYKYDANGNLDTISSSNHYLQYDYENRITQYKWGVKRNYDYYYNGDGVRLQKACGANTGETSTKYVHDGMNAVLEFDSDMNLQYKYIYANGMLLGRVDASDQEAYYHHDGIGSTIGITDATPSVTKSYLYDEFGTAIGIWGDAVNTYKYTGQEAEGGPTDGYNLRAREYYTGLGRFMQNDPIGDRGGSLNWYSYVGNNPINLTDVSGLSPIGCYDPDIAPPVIPGPIPPTFINSQPNPNYNRCVGNCYRRSGGYFALGLLGITSLSFGTILYPGNKMILGSVNPYTSVCSMVARSIGSRGLVNFGRTINPYFNAASAGIASYAGMLYISCQCICDADPNAF